MSPRALVYAVVASVVALLPLSGSAQTVTAVRLAPKNTDGSVTATSTVAVACDAVKSGMMGGAPSTGTITVSGGTLDGGVATVAVTYVLSGAVYTASANWTTPAPGAATVSCWAKAATFGSGSTLIANVVVAAPAAAAPVVTSFGTVPAAVLVGAAMPVSVAATDPAGLPLTYAWTATGGTFTDPTAASTDWTAPSAQGSYTLTVTITNSAGATASRSAVVNTAIALFQSTLKATMTVPLRMAATPSGDLYVINRDGKLFMMTRDGGLKLAVALGSAAKAVATSVDTVFVATETNGILKIDPASGRVVGRIPVPFYDAISGLAWDSVRSRLWAATGSGAVYALAPNGSIAGSLTGITTSAFTRSFSAPVADVAYDSTNDVLWVAENRTEKNPDFTDGQMLHAFKASDLGYLRSTAGYGSQVTSVNGAVVGTGGKLYVSDSYSGVVQAFESTGAALGGIGAGQLSLPAGLAFMANGDLAVANSHLDRIDRFGTGAGLPTCAGDADCDGIPDAYDRLPSDPSNALTDFDGDGLNDLEEYALGTDPTKKDTDGDGFTDGDERLAGFDPLNPNDHRPMLYVGGPVEAPPGLVRIHATAAGAGTCVASWSQVGGETVRLRDPTTFSPSFVARKAGTYRFAGVATCGAATSDRAVAEVRVLDVAPIADAGRTVVTSPGKPVTLSGAFSSDANGDALTYAWDAVDGSPIDMSATGATLTVTPRHEGYHAFRLTATDPGKNAGEAVVTVVVLEEEFPTAIVAKPIVLATVGVPVTLDARASVPREASFSWVDAAGAIQLPPVAAPAFVPPAPGKYVFDVTVSEDDLRSPPARVVVLASPAAEAPVAAASAPSTGTLDAPLTLDGTGSRSGDGSSLAYAWRQVAGPAAGLTDADAASATVVPFAPGAYAFEVTVTTQSGAVSAPALVRFDVAPSGKPLPVARIAAPAARAHEGAVTLDGRASTGGDAFHWTQVAGPWTDLDGARGTAVLHPEEHGTYGFELVVDDGTVRSAPATVTVNVQ